ncbi:MAG: TIR domain-containing protein [Oscillospiraceae bacterium]|nr:TIR domain-containing protein [Oscillospiraceae bacterium]
MATLQCKMCGGDLALPENGNVAVCEFCGLKQTIPTADDDKKLALFERANRLRRACDFDKAAGVYESIVTEFPREAEAWWGLVLCKYGIEYVEDPASGKPIPTCHRSSFDSVMEDSDLDMALENTDQLTRKQYRDDAKQIEEIRKGIIAVSANEDPYDVFICYKETDEKGERTLDSVLAQDIYKELTREGYRVFFARITLEHKLGEEYEPYIFAALNSAKVMLVVGTDYEYFNAVWVKNEWSRYLKLMEKDHQKHLIPCYKGIDAYDMPPEFKRLQAQDLGKVGAVQDILYGIEKLIPRQPEAPQPAAPVAGNKLAALINRGNMALEDGDWRAADGFFEEVLNNDAQNAHAYLGKALAKERVASLDQLVQNRRQALDTATGVKLVIDVDLQKEKEIIDSYNLENYVSRKDLEQLLLFNPEYDSFITARTDKSHNEKVFWEQHKFLKRAEQFADQDLAKKLRAAREETIAYADTLVEKSIDETAKNKADREAEYAKHLKDAEAEAQRRYQEGQERREADYQALVERAENAISAKDANELMEAQKGFAAMRAYKESAAMIDSCRRALAMIDDDRRKAAEKAEQDRIRQEKVDRAKAKAKAFGKKVRNFFIKVAVVIAIIVFLVLLFTRIIPGNKYKDAVAMMDSGDYYGAAEVFINLDDFEDSPQKACECIQKLIEGGEPALAAELLEQMEYYEGAQEALYACAEKFLETDSTYEAATCFGKITDYSDAFQRSKALWLGLTNRQYSDLGSEGYVAAVTKDGKVNVNACWLNDAYGVSTLEESPLAQIEGVEAVALRGGEDLIMLMSDGTVKVECVNGSDCGIKSTLGEWKNVIDIAAGNDNVIALCMDGTVVTTAGSGSVSDCGNLIDVVAGGGDDYFGGIRADGTVWTHGTVYDVTQEIAEWTDIIDFDIGGYQVVGLKSDGTVLVSCSYESDNQSKAESWTGMVEVACGYDYVLGIRSDGEIISTKGIGMDGLGFAFIEAGRQERVDYYVGVKADGTLKAYGEYWNADTDLAKLSDWKNIKVEDELPDFAPEDQQNTPALPPQ